MANTLKTYASPWQGRLLLACRKCQKKLKGNPDLSALAKLKKTIKRQSKENPEQALDVISVPYMDLCQKDGVTLCDPREPSQLMILRSESEIETFRR